MPCPCLAPSGSPPPLTALLLLLQVVTIGSTAVGIGVQCEDYQCEWDSVPFMQNNYTLGHRQLMMDCLGIDSQASQPSQNNTRVTIAQRLFSRGRSFLNVAEMQTALQERGAAVDVVHLEGRVCHLPVARSSSARWGLAWRCRGNASCGRWILPCHLPIRKKRKITPLGVITGASRPRGSPRLSANYQHSKYGHLVGGWEQLMANLSLAKAAHAVR